MHIYPQNNIPAEQRVYMSAPRPNKQSWCGHRFDAARFPKKSCDHCWSFFFVHNVEFTRSVVDTASKDDGEQTLTQTHGTKFVKQLKRFLIQMAKAKEVHDLVDAELKKEQEAATAEEYDIVIPAPEKEEAIA